MTENDVKDPELSGCSFAKTVLMLLVLFYHSILFFSGTWFTKDPAEVSLPLTYLARWLNHFHIYGFALISGYLFHYGRIECGKYPTYRGFLLQKAKRLLLPYVFVAALWVAPFHWFFFRCGPKELIDKYLLGKSANQLWFLLMLFGVFMIFYPLAGFFHRHTLLGAAVVLTCHAASLYLPYSFLSYYGLRHALAYLPVFWLGFILRRDRDAAPARLLRRIPSAVLVAAHVGLFALVEFLGGRVGGEATLLMHALRFSVTTGGAVMAFSVLVRLAERIPHRGRLFRLLTACSMPIYLFHQQIVYVAVTLMNRVMSPYLQVPIITLLALGISLGISLLLLRFRYTRPLVGAKM